jgi:hypothetical protein
MSHSVPCEIYISDSTAQEFRQTYPILKKQRIYLFLRGLISMAGGRLDSCFKLGELI